MSDVPKLRCAIVGCGAISRPYAINLQNMLSITDVVMACDLDKAAAEARAKEFGIPRTGTLEDALAAPDVDVVVNLTGPAAHYAVIRQCLEAGKHVWTEKTLASTLEQARELVDLANERGFYLGVAPDTILGAGVQTARNVLDSGLIGEVTSVVACVNRDHGKVSEIARFARTPGGSLPYDMGPYYVATLLYLLGPVARVSGFMKEPGTHAGEVFRLGNYGEEWRFASSNLMASSLVFESGVIGSLHFTGESIMDSYPHIALYGTKGILFVGDPDSFRGEVRLALPGADPVQIPFTHGFAGKPQYLADGTETYVGSGHRGIGVAEMCWSIVAGRPNRCSKELGLATLEVIEGTRISSETGSVYEMTTTFERPAALPAGYYPAMFGGSWRLDSEASLA